MDDLFQVLVGTDADAHLKHQGIQNIQGNMVRIQFDLSGETEKTAGAEEQEDNDTVFHLLPPFLKNKLYTAHAARMLPNKLDTAKMAACQPN